MKSKRLKLLLLLFVLVATVARTEEKALLVALANGTTAAWVLDEKPKVTFDAEQMCIRTDEATTHYAYGEVKSFTFVDEKSLAADAPTDACSVFRYVDGVVEAEGRDICVYDANGRCVARAHDRLSLRDQVKGTYIVTIGKQSIKVIRK